MPLEDILARRSVRRYTGQPISEESIQDLLRAAMSAPSAGNARPWQFVVIRDRGILDAIPRFHEHAGMLTQANVAILVCADLQLVKHEEQYWIQDCSAATENILLAAQSLGLGAVWLGVYPVEERIAKLREMLGLPAHIIPFSLIPVGYPAENKDREDRYQKERVHYNRW